MPHYVDAEFCVTLSCGAAAAAAAEKCRRRRRHMYKCICVRITHAASKYTRILTMEARM